MHELEPLHRSISHLHAAANRRGMHLRVTSPMTLLKNALLLLVFLGVGLGAGIIVQGQIQRSGAGADVRVFDRSAARVPESNHPILLSLSTCPACRLARQWLDQRGIEYIDLVVDQGQDARDVFDRLGAKAVPVFLIGDTQVTGFDPGVLETVLAARTPTP
jgi:glutaredoxin 3